MGAVVVSRGRVSRTMLGGMPSLALCFLQVLVHSSSCSASTSNSVRHWKDNLKDNSAVRPDPTSFPSYNRFFTSSSPFHSSSTPAPSQFVFSDCGMNVNRPIRVLNITANPKPLRTPGKVKFSALVNVTDTLPDTLSVDLHISKYFFGILVKIPCYENVGTCHYKDLCRLLSSLYPTDESCPRVLRKRRIPCRCPFTDGLYNLSELVFHIPPLEGLLEPLATGEYEVRARIHDRISKQELGCVELKFDMKSRRQKRKRARIAT